MNLYVNFDSKNSEKDKYHDNNVSCSLILRGAFCLISTQYLVLSGPQHRFCIMIKQHNKNITHLAQKFIIYYFRCYTSLVV